MFGFHVVASYRFKVLLLLALAEFMHCKLRALYSRHLQGKVGRLGEPGGRRITMITIRL